MKYKVEYTVDNLAISEEVIADGFNPVHTQSGGPSVTFNYVEKVTATEPGDDFGPASSYIYEEKTPVAFFSNVLKVIQIQETV